MAKHISQMYLFYVKCPRKNEDKKEFHAVFLPFRPPHTPRTPHSSVWRGNSFHDKRNPNFSKPMACPIRKLCLPLQRSNPVRGVQRTNIVKRKGRLAKLSLLESGQFLDYWIISMNTRVHGISHPSTDTKYTMRRGLLLIKSSQAVQSLNRIISQRTHASSYYSPCRRVQAG